MKSTKKKLTKAQDKLFTDIQIKIVNYAVRLCNKNEVSVSGILLNLGTNIPKMVYDIEGENHFKSYIKYIKENEKECR